MKKLINIVSLICLICLIDSGYALECYTCDTIKGQRSACEHPTNSTVYHEECGGVSTICVTLLIDVKSDSTITRSCAPAETCATSKNYPGLKYCGYCLTDLCNIDVPGISPFADFTPSAGYSPNYSTSLGIFAAIYITLKLRVY